MHWTSLLIYNEGKDISIIGFFTCLASTSLEKIILKLKIIDLPILHLLYSSASRHIKNKGIQDFIAHN
jgi:hypothetical protein